MQVGQDYSNIALTPDISSSDFSMPTVDYGTTTGYPDPYGTSGSTIYADPTSGDASGGSSSGFDWQAFVSGIGSLANLGVQTYRAVNSPSQPLPQAPPAYAPAPGTPQQLVSGQSPNSNVPTANTGSANTNIAQGNSPAAPFQGISNWVAANPLVTLGLAAAFIMVFAGGHATGRR